MFKDEKIYYYKGVSFFQTITRFNVEFFMSLIGGFLDYGRIDLKVFRVFEEGGKQFFVGNYRKGRVFNVFVCGRKM